MGLFDIFKRKTKVDDKDDEHKSTSSSNSSSSSASVAAQANVDQSDAIQGVVADSENVANMTSPAANPVEQQTKTGAAVEIDAQLSDTSESKTTPVSESIDSKSDQSTTKMQSASAAIAQPADSADASGAADPATDVEQQQDDKYEQGLAKSRSGFGARLNALLANFRHVDEDFFDDLEEALIESDVGFDMAVSLSDQLREEVKLQNAKSQQEVTNVIIEKLVDIYEQQGKNEDNQIHFAENGPTVILFVGVNGVGKTTTIGKMAALYQRQGKKVLLAAADTFRAGATEQLQVWGERDHVKVVTGPDQGDPAAVVYDAVSQAKNENYDVLFVDTAGRLQNKVNLMNELAKMKRIISREIDGAPQEVLLVLDSTTGQNALTQAKLFKESTDVTGIVLTKLDGTARGGIVLAIRNELHLPVKMVGLGEQVDDLQAFDASEFVYGLFKGLVKPN